MTEKITPRQQEILDKITPIFVEKFGLDKSDIKMDESLDGLDLVAMDCIELFMDLQIEFDLSIPDEEPGTIRTVGDIVRLIEKMSAEPATKAADKTVAPKTQTETKSKPDVQITITNVQKGNEKPTTLNCGTITDAQKQEFLNAVSEYKPSATNGDNHTCGFNLYYAESAKRVVPYDIPKDFQASQRKIGENELVVEMVPVTTKECGSWANYHCPICLASGDCTSPFVRKYIGTLLFPDKYGKER
jgi:acyl carrier protein